MVYPHISHNIKHRGLLMLQKGWNAVVLGVSDSGSAEAAGKKITRLSISVDCCRVWNLLTFNLFMICFVHFFVYYLAWQGSLKSEIVDTFQLVARMPSGPHTPAPAHTHRRQECILLNYQYWIILPYDISCQRPELKADYKILSHQAKARFLLAQTAPPESILVKGLRQVKVCKIWSDLSGLRNCWQFLRRLWYEPIGALPVGPGAAEDVFGRRWRSSRCLWRRWMR